MWYLRSLKQSWRALHSRIDLAKGPDQEKPGIVFAPHPDDEVLGCGGTIILKRDLGTPVKIVFMTDGRTSHQRFLSIDELCRMRREESIDACSVLGVGSGDLHFLNFPDGQLDMHHELAVSRVIALLGAEAAPEVFVPYRSDGTADHEATFRIVREAIRRLQHEVRVFEYPVWVWNQWPWVRLSLVPGRETLLAIKVAVRSGFGRQLLQDFRSGAVVGPVLDRKRQALARHRTQMEVLRPGTDWPTLDMVSQGDFLKCFFQEHEIFHSWDSSALNHP